MIELSIDDKKNNYPSVYNIYPIVDEISFFNNIHSCNPDEDEMCLDEQYGRRFSKSLYNRDAFVYGASDKLPYYFSMNDDNYKVESYLRVPYRKIPIFQVDSNSRAKALIEALKTEYQDYYILFRGQEKLYTIERTKEEKYNLFGDENALEPSFLSSHARENLDENFLRCLWNWQGRTLFSHLESYLKTRLKSTEYSRFLADKQSIEGSERLSYFSLGMAQHYGLPSVGLDLTDKYESALCFASTHYEADDENNLNVTRTKNFNDSMIYVFRCPKNLVFNYKVVRPAFIPTGRPDCQNAWFGHVGWGDAKNQMAMYLVCCIKVTPGMSEIIDAEYVKGLFPSAKYDVILQFFLDMKKSDYSEEVRKILGRVYEVNFKNLKLL
ncbi:hypothetical protein [Butyrivibrio sp. AE3004]|uniref:hypothetical protein n=1 Tax=Butyrivibrio sp. AE3004 TaxID=1506994 RepID=UPI00049417DF|nr:hypothetical protein [Butyrivibrio sp. AE3004]